MLTTTPHKVSPAFVREREEREAENTQPKMDFGLLQAQIIQADDRSEPMTRSRHNLIDPTNDEIMAFLVDYMDGTDARLLEMQREIENLRNLVLRKG